MSIGNLRKWAQYRGRVEAARRKFGYGYNLIARQVKPFHDFVDGGPDFRIVKHDRDGRPGIAKYPRAATLTRYAFYVKLLPRGRPRFVDGCEFIPDDHDASRLRGWAKTPRQTTDGHLAELALANDSVPATPDERIPGSLIVPG
jgi:hypothetical protein